MTADPTPVADELAVMRRIVVALDKLDTSARDRVVAWLWDRYLDGRHVVVDGSRTVAQP